MLTERNLDLEEKVRELRETVTDLVSWKQICRHGSREINTKLIQLVHLKNNESSVSCSPLSVFIGPRSEKIKVLHSADSFHYSSGLRH